MTPPTDQRPVDHENATRCEPRHPAVNRSRMPGGMSRWVVGVISLVLGVGTGCSVTVSKRSPWDINRLAELSDELEQFKNLKGLQESEADQLRRTKDQLEHQVGSDGVTVGYDERGLVARFVEQLLFNSGQATLRQGAAEVLSRVATVLQENPAQRIGVEGHTDNEPIQVSGWADNRALSLARANAVADYLKQHAKVSTNRLTITGYGELRPIASNESAEGRQKNRRVEIVILPRSLEQSYEVETGWASEGETQFSK